VTSEAEVVRRANSAHIDYLNRHKLQSPARNRRALERPGKSVEKVRPSRANNPLQGEGKNPLLGTTPTKTPCAFCADLSNLVLENALSK